MKWLTHFLSLNLKKTENDRWNRRKNYGTMCDSVLLLHVSYMNKIVIYLSCFVAFYYCYFHFFFFLFSLNLPNMQLIWSQLEPSNKSSTKLLLFFFIRSRSLLKLIHSEFERIVLFDLQRQQQKKSNSRSLSDQILLLIITVFINRFFFYWLVDDLFLLFFDFLSVRKKDISANNPI